MSIGPDEMLQVAALVAKYNRSFDNDQVESWIETFLPDGVFVAREEGPVTGHKNLRSWFGTKEHNTIHVTADPTIVEEDGAVRHRCTVMVFRRTDDGVFLGSVGEYDDLLTKTNEGWRFVRRAPVTTPLIR